MSTTRTSRFALLVSFAIVLVSSGGGGEAPDAHAFSTATATGTEAFVRRPVGNPCALSDYSVSFAADVSLSDTDGSSVGPFLISLPEGVYDVTVSTWLGGEDLPQEKNEQWSFSTDSGYESPATVDSSPHLLMNQAWAGQEIDSTTAVELHHSAPDGTQVANSVHPLCIGFDAIDEERLLGDGETPDDETRRGSSAPVLLP